MNDPLSAAAWLLERWLPGVRAEIVRGEAPRVLDEDWAETPPSPERVARYGAFPEDRHPVAVERFPIGKEDLMFGAQRAGAGFPDESAEQASGFLTPVLEAAGPPDRRTRALAVFVVGMMVEDNEDLLRVAVVAEPGGPVLRDEVHLLVRAWQGHTARLALSLGEPAPDDLGTRVSCLTTLLSEFLYMNNNNQVDFEVGFWEPGEPVEIDWEFAETEEEEERGFLRKLSPDELDSALTGSEQAMIELAWAVAVGDASLGDPDDLLVRWLFRDLIGTLRAAVGPPVDAHGAGLPLELAGEGACLVLAGSERTAVVEIDDGF
ncbi:hypothetical protein ACSNOI_05050 [Actinomadura kijaniata]|uniref:hypothetical protein n=1 Tax=Actinomadura kijaniata TaxID=46161 RepID=UPI003F198645